MSDNKVLGTSSVTNNDGKTLTMQNLEVPVERFYNFVQQNAKHIESFKDHSLEYCLEYIISRGLAEITRQVKAQAERARQQASAEVLNKFNLSPEQAKVLLAKLVAEEQAKAAAQAKKV